MNELYQESNEKTNSKFNEQEQRSQLGLDMTKLFMGNFEQFYKNYDQNQKKQLKFNKKMKGIMRRLEKDNDKEEYQNQDDAEDEMNSLR